MLSERLRQWRESRGLTQPQAAELVGVPFRTYIGYEHGKSEPKSGLLAKLLTLGCDIEWLLSGKHREPTIEFSPGNTSLGMSERQFAHEGQKVWTEYQFINSLNLTERVKGFYEEDQPDQPVGMSFSTMFIDSEIHRQPDRLFIAYASDNGMSPLISDGDMVAVDHKDREVTSNRIYALRINDRILLRRLRTDLRGAVTVVGDNPDFPPEPLPDPADGLDVAVVGRVIWHSKRV